MITPAEIRRQRQSRGLTQMQVALMIGVSYPAYRLWEAGGCKPTPENEEKLREKLMTGDDAHAGNEASR